MNAGIKQQFRHIPLSFRENDVSGVQSWRRRRIVDHLERLEHGAILHRLVLLVPEVARARPEIKDMEGIGRIWSNF